MAAPYPACAQPENIFICATGQLLIGDFGLAAHKERDNLTERVGTLDYMAPEVCVCARACVCV